MTTVNEYVDMRSAPLRIGMVRLDVRDLDAVANFYKSVLGFTLLETAGGRITLGTDKTPLLELLGDSGEYETSFQLATRPHLVHMERLEGVHTPLVGWDLVAPMAPVRTYGRRPDPQSNHASIFGDPHVASAESGHAFLKATVDAVVTMMETLQGSYTERREGGDASPRSR